MHMVLLSIFSPVVFGFDITNGFLTEYIINAGFLLFYITTVLLLISNIVNIIYFIKLYKINNSIEIYKRFKKLFIGLIPLWAIHIISHIILYNLYMLYIEIVYIPIIITCVISISYSILFIFSLRKNEIISFNKFILHALIQLIPVICIIDSIYLLNLKKQLMG